MTQQKKSVEGNSSTGTGADHGLPGWKDHGIFWAIAGSGIALDLWSKSAVHAWLKDKPNQSYSIIDGFLQFIIRENSGAAFSFAQGKSTMLMVIALAALVAVLCYFLFGGIRQRILQIAMALFLAGIVGNLYDRIFNQGCVRDFIDVYLGRHHWPTFNVADSLLCTGVGLLILSQLCFSPKPTGRK